MNRAAMVPVTSQARAYFAPVDRAAETVAIFDPAKHGAFDLNAPPPPWIDLGCIDNLARSSATITNPMLAGSPAVACGQHRTRVAAQVEFDFREWGKLQMALAGGSQHMNVLGADPSADPQPSGGAPAYAIALLPGSTANQLIVGPGSLDAFAPGDLVAVDIDYSQQVGFVGTGVAAAYVKDPLDVRRDPHYIRRVTFNVARVAQKTATSVLLAQPLIGGDPAPGASAQKVVAFVDRECGSFFQEWSALFIFEEASGGRACFYYPRLSPTTPINNDGGFPRESKVEVAPSIHSLSLHAAFIALPNVDGTDGETVVCYRSYFPAAASPAY